jgi:PAS domain-containing protein
MMQGCSIVLKMQTLDRERRDVAGPKPIQIILARQLAGSIAIPTLVMDTVGALIYENEFAEAILGQQFDETGELLAYDWSKLFALGDDTRNPIANENLPMILAISGKRPVSRAVWMPCGDREWRYLNIIAYPLIGEGRRARDVGGRSFSG